MAGKIDKQALKKIIFENSNVQKKVLQIANASVEAEKNILITKFKEHPVTQEIEGGENASNLSGTLGGYGNLFSFIGFSNSSNPIAPILSLLNNIKINKKILFNKNNFVVNIYVPSKEDFGNASKMPWENRSWLWGVEKSISGLGAYLYGKFENSRSGKAIQSRKNFRGKVFTRISYFTPLYNNFIKKLGGKIK